jgi:hypothetical protein
VEHTAGHRHHIHVLLFAATFFSKDFSLQYTLKWVKLELHSEIYTGIHVKWSLRLSDINGSWKLSTGFLVHLYKFKFGLKMISAVLELLRE